MIERPLSWLHFTLLGAGVLPDLRIRLDTITPISEDLIKKAFIGLGNIQHNCPTSPLLWKQNEDNKNEVSPEFLESILPKHRRRVLHVRQRLERSIYQKSNNTGNSFHIPSSATVTLVREFNSFGGMCCLQDSFEKAEIKLEYKLTSARFQTPYVIKQLTAQLLSESVELGRGLLCAGIRVGI